MIVVNNFNEALNRAGDSVVVIISKTCLEIGSVTKFNKEGCLGISTPATSIAVFINDNAKLEYFPYVDID